MRVLDLVLKDLSQVLRDKKSLLFLVAMPIVFTLFMGFAYRGATEPQDNRLALGWVNHDPDGLLSQRLYAMLADSDAVKWVDVAPAQAEEQMRKGTVSGVLVVPTRFSQKALAGEPIQLILMADEFSTAGQSLYQLARPAVTQLMSAVEIARLDVQTIHAGKPFASEEERQAELAAAFNTAAQSWAENAQSGSLIQVEKAVRAEPGVAFGGNPYNQASPGILVQFAIFGLVASAQILVQERKIGTLQRLITTAMKPWQIIAGHMLAMFVIVFLQTVLLIVFGQWVLRVDYLREPVGTLLVATTLGLWVSSVGLVIGVIAQSEEQVVLYSLIAMFVLTGLGGAWFPLEGAGRVFAAVGQLTPTAWAMDGFQNILIRGSGLTSALLPSGILLAYAVGFFVAAMWRFHAGRER